MDEDICENYVKQQYNSLDEGRFSENSFCGI